MTRAGGERARATPTPSKTPKTHPTGGATAATPNTLRRPSQARPKPMKRHGRRPRFKSPFSEARDRVLRTVTLPFRRLPPTPRLLVGFLALAILTTLLLARTHSSLTSAEVYQEGDVVRADVTAPADITGDDSRQTDARRAAARANTPPVWDYDPARIESAVQSFRTSWMMLRQPAEVSANANSNGSNANVQRELLWPGQAPDKQAVARAVAAHNFAAGALEMLTHMMRDADGGYVYDERDAAELRSEVRVADARVNGAEVLSAERSRFTSVDDEREQLRGRVSEVAGG